MLHLERKVSLEELVEVYDSLHDIMDYMVSVKRIMQT